MNTIDKNIIIVYAGLEDGHGKNSLNHGAENYTMADLYYICVLEKRFTSFWGKA